jgi:hypothetical protein
MEKLHFKNDAQKAAFKIDDKYRYLLVDLYWYVTSQGYMATNVKKSDDKRTILLMHRHILTLEHWDVNGHLVDHIDGNKLNNQLSNLRLVNYSQNGWNSEKRKRNTSGYKGVSWNKGKRMWKSSIMVNRKQIFLGYYKDIELARQAYSEAEVRYQKEFSISASREAVRDAIECQVVALV